jgi:sulfhydrogenase subunit beta (sulfur reductase)
MADMGATEPPEGGFDLFMTDLGDRYYIESGRPKGAEIVKFSGACRPAAKDDHKAKLEFDIKKAENLVKRLPYNTRYLPELLDDSYDSLLWDAISRRCFSCGTCTNVCPTCYCFDVQDKLNLDTVSGSRQRRWDSCQLKVFAEVAGGENFREHRSSRTRHRMFRKGKYINARTGKLGCVGCGRCIQHCVAKISILEAFQQIGGEADLKA